MHNCGHFFHFQLTLLCFVFFFNLGLLVNLAVKRATRLLNNFTKSSVCCRMWAPTSRRLSPQPGRLT